MGNLRNGTGAKWKKCATFDVKSTFVNEMSLPLFFVLFTVIRRWVIIARRRKRLGGKELRRSASEFISSVRLEKCLRIRRKLPPSLRVVCYLRNKRSDPLIRYKRPHAHHVETYLQITRMPPSDSLRRVTFVDIGAIPRETLGGEFTSSLRIKRCR